MWVSYCHLPCSCHFYQLNPLLQPLDAAVSFSTSFTSFHAVTSMYKRILFHLALFSLKVSSLLKEAMEIKTDIESPGFLEEQTAQQSLEQFSEYEAQLKRLAEQAKSYMEYHQQFGSIRTSKRHY